MKEANFQTMFKEWLASNPPVKPTAYELKICKGTSIPFDALATHQGDNLLRVKTAGIYHKIADTPFNPHNGMRFNKPKPFDCFFLQGDAFVVILWYVPREKKIAYFIDIEEFIAERDRSPRKSLIEQRAREISKKVIML